MNNRFDELTKGLAQSFTGRAALKKFGLRLTDAQVRAPKLRQERHVYSHGASRTPSSVRSGMSRSPSCTGHMPLLTELGDTVGAPRFYKHGAPNGAIRELRR